MTTPLPTTRTAWNKGLESPFRGKKLPAEPLSEEELQRIFVFLESHWGVRGLRTRAFIVLLLRGLMRCKEALDLYPKDMELDVGTIRILHGKGDQSRVIGMDPKACLYIREWMEERAEYGIGDTSPVICSIRKPNVGRPLFRNWARSVSQLLRIRCGIHKRVHPHGFRHTGATQMLHEGAPLHIISKQLGHKNLATTERYINHVHPGTVINYMQNRIWHDHHWGAVPTNQKVTIVRESRSSVGYVVTLHNMGGPDKYLRFPSELVQTLPEATFFESRDGANAAVEQLLTQLDLRHYTPEVQAVIKGA